MADIFVEIAGQKTQVTKSRLFEMAQNGIVQPETKLWYGDRQATCAKVNGIVFAQPKPVPDAQEDAEESEEIFSLQMDELPERPASHVAIVERESPEAVEAREEAEQKQQKKIILIVTVVSVFCMLVIIRGLTCFMSDLSTKVKTNADVKKKGRNRGAEQLPQLPPREAPPAQNPDTPSGVAPVPADGNVPVGQPAGSPSPAPAPQSMETPQENATPGTPTSNAPTSNAPTSNAPTSGTPASETAPAAAPMESPSTSSDDGMGSVPVPEEKPKKDAVSESPTT